MKKNMYAIIDTETANGLKNPMCYVMLRLSFSIKKETNIFEKIG